MTRSQQIKIFQAMNEIQKARVAKLIAEGLNRNTAISSVVMQDMLQSKLPRRLVAYGS
jgi:hypothetical protein